MYDCSKACNLKCWTLECSKNKKGLKMSYNKIILVGNLTRDIELRYAHSGSAIANTGIATSRKFTSNGERKEEVCFTDITFFGKSAETANQYLRKGSKVLVEGRLKLDQWQDQQGNKRSKHSVIVESMQMLDSKPDNQQQAQQQQQQNQNQGYGQQQMPDQTNAIDVDPDEIPFAPMGLQYPRSLYVI